MLNFKCYLAHSRHKDDRACYLIIAGALDPDNKISPAQVSRKLKELGLRSNVRRRKTTEKIVYSFLLLMMMKLYKHMQVGVLLQLLFIEVSN
jgi:arginine repressor